MADKPSRALVFYGDGLARLIGPAQTHLHSLASRASCGFLALPHLENEETLVIREFAELLDAPNEDTQELPTIAERFMGMKAALITEDPNLKSFGTKLGFETFQWNELSESGNSLAESPPLASGLLKLLGFEQGKILDTSHFDLVFVHVGASEKVNDFTSIELVNELVGNLLQITQSDSHVGSRLHISVIMSYGAALEGDHLEFSVSDAKYRMNGEFLPLVPRQSYMMKGGKPRVNVRDYCPMLLAQYQKAVTRKDMVESFSSLDFIENGGNLVIPADRFLHEVAFKLWRAPKYGA